MVCAFTFRACQKKIDNLQLFESDSVFVEDAIIYCSSWLFTHAILS